MRIRLTLRHRFDFGGDSALVGRDLVRPEAWDALRTRSTGPFALPATRAGWEAEADARLEIEARARALDNWFASAGAARVASYGAGTALLELWLQRIDPARSLVLTDYGPATVERLRALFPEAEIVRHDLAADPPLAADVHLFHRVDSELSNDAFRDLLARFREQRIVLVATDVLGAREAIRELVAAVRPGAANAGWARNRAAFESLWKPTHRSTPIRFHDLDGWILEPAS